MVRCERPVSVEMEAGESSGFGGFELVALRLDSEVVGEVLDVGCSDEDPWPGRLGRWMNRGRHGESRPHRFSSAGQFWMSRAPTCSRFVVGISLVRICWPS